nr:immunoglobulin light chain junction region [Macaca mulatta]MOW61198.1 immunoglobulin light chain junction region [Macaca mulatta]MOY09827.1 immunoglobulin light chain junction region [Macaca mulatta]
DYYCMIWHNNAWEF